MSNLGKDIKIPYQSNSYYIYLHKTYTYEKIIGDIGILYRHKTTL